MGMPGNRWVCREITGFKSGMGRLIGQPMTGQIARGFVPEFETSTLARFEFERGKVVHQILEKKAIVGGRKGKYVDARFGMKFGKRLWGWAGTGCGKEDGVNSRTQEFERLTNSRG